MYDPGLSASPFRRLRKKRKFNQVAGQSNRSNSIPEFAELRAALSQGDDETGSQKILKVDLRIQPGDLEADDGEVLAVVSIVRAVISLNLDGMDVAPGSRLGEPVKGPGATIKTAKRETIATSAKGGGSATVGMSTTGQPEGSIKASVDGSRERVTTVTTESDEHHQHLYVKARGNDTWEITEPDGRPLDGTYLDDQALCEFILKAGANRAGVQSSLEVKQKDLRFDFPKSTLGFLSNNKKKLLGVVLAKSLSESKEDYKGRIILSRVENDHE